MLTSLNLPLKGNISQPDQDNNNKSYSQGIIEGSRGKVGGRGATLLLPMGIKAGEGMSASISSCFKTVK